MGPPAPKPFSPVHSALKFSHVLGTTSSKSLIISLPIAFPSTDISMKTLLFLSEGGQNIFSLSTFVAASSPLFSLSFCMIFPASSHRHVNRIKYIQYSCCCCPVAPWIYICQWKKLINVD